MAASWRTALETAAPIVFWNQIDGGGIALNAITGDWLRIDLSIQDMEIFSACRARNLVRPLIDRDGIYDAPPPSCRIGSPIPKKLHYIINEFIRVLGPTPVAMGRGEYVTAVWGSGLLRNLLIDLLQQQHVTLPDSGGALHLSRLLPPEQTAMLAAPPYPGPTQNDLSSRPSGRWPALSFH
ncbi:MAG: hypothetical protein MO852_11620 [Candidatus Devosia euplotis]|nr:hypothetical protein [Candidatus Devosia euplotis]